MFDMPTKGSWEVRSGWVVRQLEKDLNFPFEAGAGVCGNFGVESIEFTVFQEIGPKSGRGGAGWGQWTGPRRRNFEKWASANGLDPTTDEASYGFMVFEFRGGDSTMEPGSDFRSMATQLRSGLSLEEATNLVYEWYERPQEVLNQTFESRNKRLDYARRALKGAQEGQEPSQEPEQAPVAPSHPLLRLTPPPTTGPEVELLQNLLIKKGFNPGRVDGVFGSRTELAVKLFQRAKNLVEDGIVGPKTWAKLEG